MHDRLRAFTCTSKLVIKISSAKEGKKNTRCGVHSAVITKGVKLNCDMFLKEHPRYCPLKSSIEIFSLD